MRSKAKWICCMVAMLGLVAAANSQAALVLDDMEDISGWTTTNCTKSLSTECQEGSYSQMLSFTTGGSGSTTWRDTIKTFGVDLTAYDKIGFWFRSNKPEAIMFQFQNLDSPGVWSHFTQWITYLTPDTWHWLEFDMSGTNRNWVEHIKFAFQDDWHPNSVNPDTAYELSFDDLQAIPEPATLALLTLGLPLALRRRRS
ncbi:MAG: PEP-CTERM sorting domain-containing protein [Planctomycetota bacterium]|nr:PEP-CTERM sorting domain-containing protein [Planctomycetota bacterium]